jgi:ABC-type Fe3+ transport system substrate-binding protein
MQSNKILFFVIIALSICVVIAFFVLRPLLVNYDPVAFSVLYSTEKEAWLEAVMADFDGEVNGRPIVVNLKPMGSREMYLAVLDGSEQPDVISPASSLQISILEEQSRASLGVPLVKPADSRLCRSVVNTPLVLVAWKERADVLWAQQVGPDLWQQLHQAVIDPAGWSSYGHSEWGYVKFSHTNPLSSNSGLMTILLMTYGYFGKTGNLTTDDLLADTDYQQWFTEFEQTTSEFGTSTGTYMRDMITYGPSKYDIVAVYESSAIEQMDNAVGRYGELRVYYPPATVMSDHPFCVLQADWVSPEQAEAAQVFIDFLLTGSAQQKALELGFRPADKSISLTGANSPFERYAANGIQLDLPAEVEVPTGNVLDTLIRLWERIVR